MSLPFKYIICSAVFDRKNVTDLKQSVKAFMSERKKDSSYFSFMNWSQTDRELLILTMYAYEEIRLPKTFDVVFQVNDPANYIFTKVKITQALLDGYAAIDYMERGHKHVCVIEFEGFIPNIFGELPKFDDFVDQHGIEIGLSSISEFQKVQSTFVPS